MILTRKNDIIRLHNTLVLHSQYQRHVHTAKKPVPQNAEQAFGNKTGYRKMYFRINSTARMYIRGVTFLALPQTTFSTT